MTMARGVNVIALMVGVRYVVVMVVGWFFCSYNASIKCGKVPPSKICLAKLNSQYHAITNDCRDVRHVPITSHTIVVE